MKTSYSYTILRYIHDILTREFINIGVVVYAPEHLFLGCLCTPQYGGEPFKLNVLLGAPQDDDLKRSYVKTKNILNKMPCEHKFVTEDAAADFAEKIEKRYLITHVK